MPVTRTADTTWAGQLQPAGQPIGHSFVGSATTQPPALVALRERPTAHVPPDTGAMRCPWCPNPSCGKTFGPPEELDLRLEPEC
jgi:hypothetical protein